MTSKSFIFNHVDAHSDSAKNAGAASLTKKLQSELDLLVTQEPVNWRAVLSLSRYEELNPNHIDGETRLATIHKAAYSGHVEVLHWCIKQGADITSRTLIGRSPLHYACDSNHPDCVKYLLKHRADPNQTTLSGQTALHVACVVGHVAVVGALFAPHVTEFVIEVDAEDGKRRPACMLTENEIIHDQISAYKDTANARRRDVQLMRSALTFARKQDVVLLEILLHHWYEQQFGRRKSLVTAEESFGGRVYAVGASEHESRHHDEVARRVSSIAGHRHHDENTDAPTHHADDAPVNKRPQRLVTLPASRNASGQALRASFSKALRSNGLTVVTPRRRNRTPF